MNFNLSVRPNVKIGLDMADFCEVGKENKLAIPAIRAIDEIESAGSGFLPSKRPKILFEGHYFYKLLKRVGLAEKARKKEPSICYPTWTKQFYIGREGEYARLAKATELCHEFDISDGLALRSASWARYQIMGENYKDAGFDSVEEFVEAMFLDEDNHLEAFIEYLKNAFLLDDLQKFPTNPAHYARIIASGYNGPGYRRNQYDTKIVNAYHKFAKQKIDCSTILKGVHVVEAMPGIRAVNPAESGFENTSLDDRYIDIPATVSDIEPGSSGSGNSILGLNDPSIPDDPTPKPAPIPEPTPAPISGQPSINLATAGGDVNQSSAETIKAASNLPDTVIEVKGNTGFLAKIMGTITAILTGQYVLPDFLANGFSGINFIQIVTNIGQGLWSLRYWIFGAIALWFIINQWKDYSLKQQTMAINTDPNKGNIILKTPSRVGIFEFLRMKLVGWLDNRQAGE